MPSGAFAGVGRAGILGCFFPAAPPCLLILPLLLLPKRALLHLAVPIMVAQLAHTATGFVDTVMAGRLGARRWRRCRLARR